jgi:hypothetical protein
MTSSIWKRPRINLLTLMIVIALIALGLWYWNWTQRGVQDAWYGRITMHVARDESLEDVLKRLKVMSISSRVPNGLPIYVDPIGLQEADATMMTTPGSDLDAKGESLKVFLNRVLKPMGLVSQLRDGLVTVTSKESLDELIAP